MARLEFFAVSESMSVDQYTNRLSLFNILEEVRSPNFPFALTSATAVSLWTMEAGDDEREFQCMLRITMPDGPQHEFTSNFRTSMRRHRVIQGFQGFLLNEPGMLRFEVLLNGRHEATHEVDILRINMDTEDLAPTAEAG